MLQKISTDKAPAAIGPYSQGIVLGNIFFASGQIPIDPATGEIHGTTIEEQAEQEEYRRAVKGSRHRLHQSSQDLLLPGRHGRFRSVQSGLCKVLY